MKKKIEIVNLSKIPSWLASNTSLGYGNLVFVATRTDLIPYHSCNPVIWWEPLADHSLKHSLKTQQCKQSFKQNPPNFCQQRVCRHHYSQLVSSSVVFLPFASPFCFVIVINCVLLFSSWCRLCVSVLV